MKIWGLGFPVYKSSRLVCDPLQRGCNESYDKDPKIVVRVTVSKQFVIILKTCLFYL